MFFLYGWYSLVSIPAFLVFMNTYTFGVLFDREFKESVKIHSKCILQTSE